MADDEIPPGLTLESLNRGLDQADRARTQAERAERAGLDVSKRLDEIEQVRARLLALRREYFPGA
jgi:hypothetical protein